jgi:hypothetical protein
MKDLEEEDRELRGMSSSSSNLFFSVSGRIVEDVIFFVVAFTEVVPF